MSRRIRQEK
uniref:Uncharacterized protein n=1 Tax=Romanomermis culicivorax TaxID=13658 RepID=A0A915JPF7_ROMCU